MFDDVKKFEGFECWYFICENFEICVGGDDELIVLMGYVVVFNEMLENLGGF